MRRQTEELMRRHIVQLRTVYVMTKNNTAAYKFIPVMELQTANGCSDASVFLQETRNCFGDGICLGQMCWKIT